MVEPSLQNMELSRSKPYQVLLMECICVSVCVCHGSGFIRMSSVFKLYKQQNNCQVLSLFHEERKQNRKNGTGFLIEEGLYMFIAIQKDQASVRSSVRKFIEFFIRTLQQFTALRSFETLKGDWNFQDYKMSLHFRDMVLA